MGARPLPLPLWDRRAGKLVYEFMDDAPSTSREKPRVVGELAKLSSPTSGRWCTRLRRMRTRSSARWILSLLWPPRPSWRRRPEPFLWPGLRQPSVVLDRSRRLQASLAVRSFPSALKQGLQELGWTDGGNIQIETRFGGAHAGRIRVNVVGKVGTRFR
jgi:hypothetical protein